MRITKLFYASLLFFVVSAILVSCKPRHGSQPKMLITGIWKVTSGVDNDGRDITQDLKNATIEFTKDGKLKVNSEGEHEEGTYTLSEDGKKLKLFQETGKTSDCDVFTLTKSKLSFKDNTEGISITAER